MLPPQFKTGMWNQGRHWQKMWKEVKLKCFAGPFEGAPPFEYFVQSPTGLVPKEENGMCLIFHLSYPWDGSLINSETPKELCSVKYNDLDRAISFCVQEGPGCFVIKSDMQSAFRHLPIRLQDWPMLVMIRVEPETGNFFYFFDKFLPFGSSIPCFHFQCFSNSVAFIFRARKGKTTNNYLDDFLFAALLKALCDGKVGTFLDICKLINFPIALDKIYWGVQIIVFLGILSDTV